MLESFTNSRVYPMAQRALRVLQMLCSIISMIVYSIRINRLSARTNLLTHAQGAVEGILVAAVFYTICVVITTFLVKGFFAATSKWLKYFLVFMDTLFFGAFIAVSVLTRPNNVTSAGPCRSQLGTNVGSSGGTGACRLPLGTFILAIIKVLLFLITAILTAIQKVRVHHHETTYDGKHNNNYAMDGRDSSTLHGRESTQVPIGGHHTTGGIGHHNGVGHTDATPYNNTSTHHGNVAPVTGSHHHHGTNTV
jgi:hypothetical protein